MIAALCMLIITTNVFAAPTNTVITSGIYDTQLDVAAIGAPNAFGYNGNWEIIKKTPLYDVDENIIAYCYDMKNVSYNNHDDYKTAYVVINATN